METLSRPQSWKNKRKRSLYVEEGYAGFIFYRKGKVPRGEEEACSQEKPPEGRHTESARVVESVSNPASDNELEPPAQEVTEGAVEVKSFVEQVKKELLVSGLEAPESKLQEVVEELIHDLSQSGSYMQFLEAKEEEDKLPPHPMDAQLAQSVMEMKQKMEIKLDRELKRIQSYCGSVLERCAAQTMKLSGNNLPTETPRTLFRAFKDTD